MFWGLVLARGSSKSIVNKNVKVLGDKPLIAWVLEPMISSKGTILFTNVHLR